MPENRLPARIWPRMPLPSGPAGAGVFSAPAAAETGVAGRNGSRGRGGGGGAHPLSGVQDGALEGEEDGRGDGFAEDSRERVFQQQAGDADRDGGQDDQPGEPLVGGPDLAVARRGGEPAGDPQ